MPAQCAETTKDQLAKDVVLSRIPAFPPVVLRALDLLGNDRTPIADLVREITSDATLSAQVLRLANSALFGFAVEIDTVQHAVVALGLYRVQSLIMAVATSNYMRAALRTEALTKCWRHSLAAAFIAQEIGRAAGLPPDRAYTVGLLHDIGRLGLLVAYPKAYDEILQEADRDSVSLLDLEQRRFGLDHCEAGRLLTEEWRLPQEFWIATGRHHDPPQGGPLDMLRVVHLSCQLADTLGYSAVRPLNPMAFETFQEMLPPSVRERVPESAEAFGDFVKSSIGEGEEHVSVAVPRSYEIERHEPEPAPVPVMSDPELSGAAQIAWDFAIVLITMGIFVIILILLYYFRTA